MGLFPEINRAWVSIDNRLYLWNYEEVSEALSINTFDDQEQIIVSVGLTKPVPGVFLAEIEYVIVVTTPIDIILLGVAFEKPLKTPGEPRGKLTLYRTDLSIASDQVNMISVAGTDQGRVFMVGNDGNLHELQYQPEEGWFTRKIRKLNHSSSSLARLIVPPFLKWVTEGGISLQNLATCISNSNSTIPLENLKSLVVDNTRSCLYTLSKENHISLIYLGQDGRDYVKIAKQTGIYQKASRFTDQYSQFVPDERNFEIVSLHPVSPSESQVVQLMAVTSTGHRLYFSHFSDLNRLPLNGKLVAPAGLVLAFVRPPLGPVTSFGYGASLDGPRGAQIHQAFYSSGLFLAANSFTEEMDRLLGITLDSGAVSQVRKAFCNFLTGL